MTGPRVYLLLVFVALLGTASVWTRITWLLPTLQAAGAYWILYRDLERNDLGGAVRHMLFWALCVSVVTVQIALRSHEAAAGTIFFGEPYREEMFTYIGTGVGAEGSPREFIPQHFLHYGLTLAISAVTGGAGGLFLGTLLLDYMNYYVGSLILAADDPTLAGLVGWPIWSVLRVAGFICGAIAMAHVFYARLLRRVEWRPASFRRLILASVALFLLDIAIKWTLAPTWRGWLQRALLGDS